MNQMKRAKLDRLFRSHVPTTMDQHSDKRQYPEAQDSNYIER